MNRKNKISMTNSKNRKMGNDRRIIIKSRDYWVNIVDFLQQYWALIEFDTEKAIVYFVYEGSGIFATMEFETREIAEKALMQNGFKKFSDPLETYADYLTPPVEPFFMVKRSGKPVINI